MFISNLSSVTVGFLVRNGFGVSQRGVRGDSTEIWKLFSTKVESTIP